MINDNGNDNRERAPVFEIILPDLHQIVQQLQVNGQGRNITFVFQQKEQTRRRAGNQAGFVQHVAKGNSEASTDESGVDFPKYSEIDIPVNGFEGIVQQVVFGNFGIAEKGFEHRIVRFVFFFAGMFGSGHRCSGLRLRR